MFCLNYNGSFLGGFMKELDYLKKVLTINEKEPAFYLLLPSQNDDISFQYLSKVAKKLYGNNPEIQLSLKTSLLSKKLSILIQLMFGFLLNHVNCLFA